LRESYRLLPSLCWRQPFEPAQDVDKGELDKLQGDWQMVSRDSQGKKIPDALAKNKLTIKGDQWILTPGATMTIKIDATKAPKWIDLTPAKGKVLPGIYKLETDSWWP
jgi:uncharacterized protein (TIGR03067 family)